MERIMVGMDEAGRGSLIGPMVVAAVALTGSAETHLAKMGVTDSKKLRKKKREELFDLILTLSLWHDVIIVNPEEIDRENLNNLTKRAFISLACQAISAGVRPSEIIADVVGSKESTIEACENVQIRMVKRGDSTFTAVGAASIVAKVIRDRKIDEIRKQYGLEGSGYPGDKLTVRWLKDNPRTLPSFLIRHKWKSKASPFLRGEG
ncbi:MAG: ribonuclease HII [Fervidicoccaceae archaeon]